eukprot:gene29497-5845_t
MHGVSGGHKRSAEDYMALQCTKEKMDSEICLVSDCEEALSPATAKPGLPTAEPGLPAAAPGLPTG